MVGESEGTESAVFAQALSALKKRGSNLLVVGAGLDGSHRAACDRLFGDAAARPRRRLRVRVDGECGVRPRGGLDADILVVDRPRRRGAVTETAAGVETPRSRVTAARVDELGAAVVGEIEAIEEDAGGLSPAELRVCFDSLPGLLTGSDDERVFRMLARVAGRIRDVDGMGHFHLPATPDAAHLARFEPLFDAVITVRTREGATEHRWRLVNDDVTSDWLPL